MMMNRRSLILKNGPRVIAGSSLLTQCSFLRDVPSPLQFKDLKPEYNAELHIREGWKSHLLVTCGDVINSAGDRFGDCADFTYLDLNRNKKGKDFLWVNHEYINHIVRYGRKLKPKEKTRKMIDQERYDVGGSYIEIATGGPDEPVGLVKNSLTAFRVTAETPIKMTGAAGVGRAVEGMVGNCCGGATFWGTILTCEENTDDFYDTKKDVFGWVQFYPRSKYDYGWVVEIDPDQREFRKHTALGRFAHEGATVVQSQSGQVVVYMGDDKEGEHFYKFISSGKMSDEIAANKDLLTDGTLYVADIKRGRWIELSPRNPLLQKEVSGKFKSLKYILENTREAAKIVGATPLARPEGVVVRENGDILLSLTQNLSKKDLYGSVVCFREKDRDFCSMDFEFSVWLRGGPELGFACPDNICADTKGDIWITTDVTSLKLGRGPFNFIPRNCLLKVIEEPGKPLSLEVFATAPDGAEFTGPSFHPDGKSLYISVQHPGEGSYEEGNKLSSFWPRKSSYGPQSGVIVISM